MKHVVQTPHGSIDPRSMRGEAFELFTTAHGHTVTPTKRVSISTGIVTTTPLGTGEDIYLKEDFLKQVNALEP